MSDLQIDVGSTYFCNGYLTKPTTQVKSYTVGKNKELAEFHGATAKLAKERSTAFLQSTCAHD
jgi:hypothetical protein